MLSIIIVSYNTEAILRKALEKVYQQKHYDDFEILVVDNASSDGSCEMVEREFPQVRLFRNPSNDGFAAGNNIAIREARGEYLLLLNSDAYIFPDTLKESVDFMDANPRTGIMGVQLVCEDGSPQPSAREFPTPWKKFKVMTGFEARHPSYETYYDYYQATVGDRPQAKSVEWVPGAYFLLRRRMVDEIGLLDENFFMYFEEVDYCLRAIKAGWNVIFNPQITVIHLGGQSSLKTSANVSRSGRQIVDIRVNSEYDYYRKHYGLLTMLRAAFFEISWKTLIWLKNSLVNDSLSSLKIAESKMAIELVSLKVGRELALR